MRREQVGKTEAAIHVENIGGIDTTDVQFTEGLNVLAGRNATNRTSLLQSIIGALGGSHVTLKADADEGHVSFTLGDETYTRTITRQNGTLSTAGDPLLGDPTVADLFAFLLESNEARRAVVREADLRDLIMRPVDTNAIKNEIRRLESEKREVIDQLDALEKIEDEISDLEREQNLLTHKIEETTADLEAKKTDIEGVDDGVEETLELKDELETRLEELNDVRSSFETVRRRLQTERKSLTALQNEFETLQEKLESVPETPGDDRSRIDSRLDRLRSRKNSMESRLSDLNSIVQFNNEMLTADTPVTHAATADTTEENAVTDGLLSDEQVTCWTCGTTVNEALIDENIDRLREVKIDIQDERAEIREEIKDLKSEKESLESHARKRKQIQRQYDQVAREISNREATIEDLEGQREQLAAELESVEAAVEGLQSMDYGEILDKHKKANELEFELERLTEERNNIRAEIQQKRRRLDDEADLSSRIAEINDRLTDLRTRIDRIEEDAVESFNHHMETILDRLDFENIERIWIEKLDGGGESRSTSSFELHVVRSSGDDVAYEDTIDHLSESEREVTGLIFALAGYLVHEVYEDVPVICLDSLEAVDATRIAALVEYFQEYADFLIVALLPEDAQAIDIPHNRITKI